jgi:thymidylate synthase
MNGAKEKIAAITVINSSFYPIVQSNRLVVNMNFMKPYDEGVFKFYGKSHVLATNYLERKLGEFIEKNNLTADAIKYDYGSKGGHIDTEWFHLIIDGKNEEELKKIIGVIENNGKEFREILKNTILRTDPAQIVNSLHFSDAATTKIFSKFDKRILKKLSGEQVELKDNQQVSMKEAITELSSISQQFEHTADWLKKIITTHNNEQNPKAKEQLRGFIGVIEKKFPVLEGYISNKIVKSIPSIMVL